MLSAWERKGPKRWPRGQRFALTDTGTSAEADYRTAVAESRASGRAVLEGALAAWAEPKGVAPKDGVVLGELRSGRSAMTELVRELEPAGFAPDDVRAAIERLVAAALLAPLPLPSETAR
ncbi:MAG TPA: hypothetical protein VLT47_13450 [Anaeromyxobacteraceae bacterium]|nr:hypothetical protein [Anaeromyxobacteraceae bacterium]